MTTSPMPQEPLETDRARLNELLGRAYEDGQLDLVDYRGLQDELYGASTRGDLARVSGRLPARYRFGDPAGAVNETALEPGQVNDPARPEDRSRAVPAPLLLGIGIGAAVLLLTVLVLVLVL